MFDYIFMAVGPVIRQQNFILQAKFSFTVSHISSSVINAFTNEHILVSYLGI